MLFAVAGAILAFAGVAHAGLIVGANDDGPLAPGEAGWFYATMASEGLTLDTITLRWDDTAPTTIADETQLRQALTLAAANGVTIELDLYPLHSMAFTGGAACPPSDDPQSCGNTAAIAAFAAWTAEVARTFPTVHQFVVMNECNQPLFVNPQWDSSGGNQSAEICGRALAASYDALKAVSSENFVWGVGLSPRGNDNPSATSNSSTSPVAFLQDLGAWFKSFVAATGRRTPLMDGLDFHPYPIPQSLPFATGYADQNDATVSNLSRIYQAFYDGFSGSPQPTIGQQSGGGLPVSLNEVGIQTAETGVAGYTGSETSANANGGVLGATATPAYQATWYGEMLDLVACDPNVRLVDIFHLVDEAALAGWQSGLFNVNRQAKQSATTVHDWVAGNAGRCQGSMHPWTPNGVVAAPSVPAPPPAQSAQRILVATAGRIRVFDAVSHELRRVIAPFGVGFTGALSLAIETNDGSTEVAVGEGSGGDSLVRVFNGKTWRQIASLRPFPASFRGGAEVAYGDLSGTGGDDLVVGSGPGVPAQVDVYPARLGTPVERLIPFGPRFAGGVSVAVGGLAASGVADLVVGSGAGVRAQVEVYVGTSTSPLESLTPFAASFRGGVSVAVTSSQGRSPGSLFVGSGPGMTTVMRAYRGTTRRPLWSIDAFGAAFSGGVDVATFTPTGGRATVVAGAGEGGGAQVRILSAGSGGFLATFLGAPASNAIAVAAG